MNAWFRVAYERALTHAVSSSLLASLVIDMSTRGHPVQDFEKQYGHDRAKELDGNPAPISSWAFDIGGMWVSGQPEDVIAVDGLAVSVACDHWGCVLADVERAKIRRFDDGAWYYKLKFWHHATALTVEQKDALEVALQDGLSKAQRRAREFFEAAKRARDAGGVS